MSELRRNAIIEMMTELKKATLVQYLKSYHLKTSGTKLQLAMRIYDETKIFTLQIHLPPSGTVSIGIAMNPRCDHLRTASGGASAFCVDCGEDLV